MLGRLGRFAQIPSPAFKDTALQRWAESITNALQVRDPGVKRGDEQDKFLTRREAIEIGLLRTTAQGSRLVPAAPDLSAVGPPQMGIPPAIESFEVSPAVQTIILSWPNQAAIYRNHALVEVWRAEVDDLGEAVLIGSSTRTMYADIVGPGASRYYWVRSVSTSSVPGPFNAVSGTLGETGVDVAYMLSQLDGQIREDQLFQDLKETIDLIVGPEGMEGSVNARIAAEALERAQDITAEATARAQAIADEAQDRANALAAEAQARADGLAAEAAARAQGLADEATDRANAIAAEAQSRIDGLAAEASARGQAIDDEEAARIAAISAEASARAQAISDEASARASAITAAENALQSEIDAINSVLSDIEGLPEFDEDDPYDEGDLVRFEGSLYRAVQSMSPPSPDPTDTDFWEKVGDYASLGDAVAAHAAQLSSHDTRITDNEGDITTQAGQISALSASLTDAENDIAGNATAISGLDSRVTTAEGDISSQATAITNLQTALSTAEGNISGNASALSALDSRVTASESDITAQASDISSLQSGLSAAEGSISANASGLSALDSRVTTAEGDITSQASDISSLQSGLSTAGNDITANAGAISALDARVTTAEGDITAQASDISSLQTGLSAAEGDISGNASAISALDTRVTSAEGELTSQASDITSLQSGLGSAETDIAGNASAISALDTRVTTAEGDITSQASDITALQSGLSTAEGDITANAGAISGLDSRVTTAESAIDSQASAITSLQTGLSTAEGDISANASALSALDSRVTSAEGDISSQSSAITSLQNDLSSAEGSISANSGAISALQSTVSDHDGEISANASAISTLTAEVNDSSTGLPSKASITDVNDALADEASARATAFGQLEASFEFLDGALKQVGENRVNNLSTVGQEWGWQFFGGGSNPVVDLDLHDHGGREVVALRAEYSSSIQRFSDWFDVGPEEVLEVEVSAWVGTNGRSYLGLHTRGPGEGGHQTSGVFVGSDGEPSTSDQNNPYWNTDLPRGEWASFRFYILGSAATGPLPPSLNANSNRDGFRLAAGQTRARLRLLGGYSKTDSNPHIVYWAGVGVRQIRSAERAQTQALQQSIVEAKADIFGASVTEFTNIQARFSQADNDLDAAVSTLNTAITDAEGNAIAESVNQVVSALGESNLAGVETRATAWNGVEAQWQVKAQVGDLVSGVGLLNDGEKTRFYIQADELALYGSDVPSTPGNAVPFIFKDGQLYLKSLMVEEGTITVAKLQEAFVDALVADQGKFVFAQIDQGNIFDLTVGNQIQSEVYAPGSDGYRIAKDGTVEFNGGTFRGAVEFTSAPGGQSNIDYANLGGTKPPADADVTADAGNITIINPGFEQGDTGWATPNAQVIDSPSDAFSGSRVLRFDGSGSNRVGDNAKRNATQEGDRWLGTCMVRGTGSGTARVSLNCRDEDGNSISRLNGNIITADGTWQESRIVEPMPPGTKTVAISWRILGSPTGTFFWDDFQLVPVPTDDDSPKLNDWSHPTDKTVIDGGKIFTGDAYVDTLQIKGQAVTLVDWFYAINAVILQGTNPPPAQLASVTINATGNQPVAVEFNCQFRRYLSNGYGAAVFRLKTSWSGTEHWFNLQFGADNGGYSSVSLAMVFLTVPSGPLTFTVEGNRGSGNDILFNTRYLKVKEAKR